MLGESGTHSKRLFQMTAGRQQVAQRERLPIRCLALKLDCGCLSLGGRALGWRPQVTMIAAFAIAFSSGWKMTLVITAVMPLLIAAGFVETKFLKGFANEVCAPDQAQAYPPADSSHATPR